MGSGGTGPGKLGRLNGIDVDAAGNAYVVDAGNHTVHVFGPTGTWRFDMGDQTLFPGDMRGIAVDDGAGRVYVANSQAGTIEVFDTAGTHLSTFASLGTGDGQFRDGARQLTLTPDGHLWAADYADSRVEEFTAAGAFVGDFPEPPQRPDPAGFASARGVAVDPVTGDVLVADNWNQRVYRFAPDGTPLQTFGQRGSFLPDGMNYPRSIAVDPATRNVWVANYEGNPDLVVFTPGFDHVVRVIHVPRFVNDLDIVGGLAYLLVRRTGSVMVFDAATGALQRTCCTNLGYLRGIAVDTRHRQPLAHVRLLRAAVRGLADRHRCCGRSPSTGGRGARRSSATSCTWPTRRRTRSSPSIGRATHAWASSARRASCPVSSPGPPAHERRVRPAVRRRGRRRSRDVFAPIPAPAPESVKPTVTVDRDRARNPCAARHHRRRRATRPA